MEQNIDKELESKLLSYQIPHLKNTNKIIKKYNICLDASDTGTGKTYTACALAKYLNMNLFVVCPASIIDTWISVGKIFGVKIVGISNYEKLIRCKYFDENKNVSNKFIVPKNNTFTWKIPKNTLIIFDEVHRCGGDNTLCSKLLLSLLDFYDEVNPLLLLSATITKDPNRFKLFGVMFRWYHHINERPNWIGNSNFNLSKSIKLIDNAVFPTFGCKMEISKLGDLFPKNSICADCYTINSKNEIDETYLQIKLLSENKNNSGQGYAKTMKLRQKIELLKIPIFLDLTQQYLENNHSIVIFTNFTNTLEILADKLKTKCLVYGEQTINSRLANIDDFMQNKERIIICNINSGSEAISLHDKFGVYARVALINPTWSCTKLIQAFGRICRSDAKSPAKNIMIYAAGTIEENICNKIKIRLNGDLDILTDQDIDLME
jgi:superfamily II DNA or RNA helicase